MYRRITAYCLIFLALLLPSRAFPDTGDVVLFSEGDLYYFNEKGREVPLKLAPKILVRFHDDDKGKKANQTIVERFSLSSALSIKTRSLPSGEGVFEITFLPGTDNAMLFTFIRRIASDPGAIPLPVFVVDNREVIIRGIVVEPKLTVDPNFVEAEINRLFDGVLVRQIQNEAGAFSVMFDGSFFLEDSKMSLTQLLLANIMHKSAEAWISGVRPRFVFLDDPVVVSVHVSPLTGTITEERTIELTVINYDTDRVEVNEKLFPKFGKGEFIPMVAHGSGTRTAPDDLFFKVLGKKPEREEYEDAQSKTITYRWRFLLYVPEKEWEIGSQHVMYRVGDFRRKAESQSVTFVSMPHLEAGMEIEDIPPVQLLPKPNIPITVPEKPELPVFWFERFVSDPHRVGSFGVVAGGLLLAAPFLFLMASAAMRAFRSETLQAPLSLEEEVRRVALDGKFYNKIEGVFAKHLRLVDSSLPRHFSLDAVKDASRKSTSTGRLLKENFLKELSDLNLLLQRRFAPESDAHTKQRLRECREKALSVACLFDYKIKPHVHEGAERREEHHVSKHSRVG